VAYDQITIKTLSLQENMWTTLSYMDAKKSRRSITNSYTFLWSRNEATNINAVFEKGGMQLGIGHTHTHVAV